MKASLKEEGHCMGYTQYFCPGNGPLPTLTNPEGPARAKELGLRAGGRVTTAMGDHSRGRRRESGRGETGRGGEGNL